MATTSDLENDNGNDRNSPNLKATHKNGKISLRTHFREELSMEHVDIILLVCCVISGLLDAGIYNAYQCFGGMQTGNTIFLALGASRQPMTRPDGYKRSLISIISFSVACFLFSRLSQLFNGPPRQRIILVVSFLIQAVLILISAILVETGTVPESSPAVSPTIDLLELAPITLLALQFGGQMVVSRVCNIGEIPTTVLTSVYCDTMIDKDVFGGLGNVKRNRRAGAIVGILGGGIAGGWIARSSAGLAGILWLTAAAKVVIAGVFAFLLKAEGGSAV